MDKYVGQNCSEFDAGQWCDYDMVYVVRHDSDKRVCVCVWVTVSVPLYLTGKSSQSVSTVATAGIAGGVLVGLIAVVVVLVIVIVILVMLNKRSKKKPAEPGTPLPLQTLGSHNSPDNKPRFVIYLCPHPCSFRVH